MLLNKYQGTFPNFGIGFPFEYYNQFLVDENNLHHGFQRGIVEDFLIIWITILIIFKLKNKNQ
jgi:hypothetical protein